MSIRALLKFVRENSGGGGGGIWYPFHYIMHPARKQSKMIAALQLSCPWDILLKYV